MLCTILELKLEHCSGVVISLSFDQLMQVQLVSVERVQPPWAGALWRRINSVITREWYIIVAAQQFLFQAPQVLSRTVYLCRSFDLLLCHISQEDELDQLLLQGRESLGAQQFAHWQTEDRHIRDEQYALELLSELSELESQYSSSQWTRESIPDADWK